MTTPNPQSSEVEKIVKEFKRLSSLTVDQDGWDIPYEGVMVHRQTDWLHTTLTHLTQQHEARMREMAEEIVEDFNWLNTNNAIPDSELGKGNIHWEMLQQISSDTRKELQARAKAITQRYLPTNDKTK